MGEKSKASEEFALAQKHSSALVPPAPGANLLIVAESGVGPVKTRAGDHGEQLTFANGDSTIKEVRVAAAGTALMAPEASSIYFQATTRGGRHIDEILKDKAKFKDATNTAGEVGVASGSALMTNSLYGNGNSASGYAGLGLMAAGLFSKAISESTVPAADTRAWDTAPNSIHLVAASGSLKTPVNVSYVDSSGSVVKDTAPLLKSEGKCRVAWTRSHLASDAPPMSPSAALSKKQLDKTSKKFREEDQAFRAQLLGSGAMS